MIITGNPDCELGSQSTGHQQHRGTNRMDERISDRTPSQNTLGRNDRGEGRMFKTTPRNSSMEVMRNTLGRVVIIAILLAPFFFVTGCGTKTPPLPVTLQLTPGTSSLVVGGSQTFSATVSNSTNTGVLWSVQEGAAGGSISASGVYTAPLKAGSYHVVATSMADATATASASITATAPAPSFTSAAPALANEGTVYSYAVVATDPVNTAITYSLVSGPAGAAISGSTLTWTPTHAQSRAANSFDIKAVTAAGGSVDQTFTVTPSGTIQGTAVDTYVTSTGNVTSNEDLSQAYIGAMVPNGSSWITIQGTGNSDGTFQIPGVPTGPYWLAVASGGYWTSANTVDLGQDFLGRNGAQLASNATTLSLNFDGITSWAADDELDIFNPNLRQDFDWSENVNVNDTSVQALWPWTGPLSDAGHGDAWYVTQMASRTVGATSWLYATKAIPGITISQADGSSTELDGTLSATAPLTVHPHVLGSQFAALASVVGTNATVHSTIVGVYSEPFMASKGEIGEAEALLEINGQDPITSDVDFGDVAFGNPFPTSWTPFFSLSYEMLVPITAAGATSPAAVPAEIYINTTLLPAASTPVSPVITPAQNVKLNGTSLAAEMSSGSLTPALTWDPPATGTPTGYRVTVYQLGRNGTTSTYQVLLDLFTKSNNMTIPPGVLLAGNQYFFGIRSYQVPGIDFTSAPYHALFPWAHTDMFTSVVDTAANAQSAMSPAQTPMAQIVRRATNMEAPRAGNAKQPGGRFAQRVTSNPVSQ
jgi:hypothetical protein